MTRAQSVCDRLGEYAETLARQTPTPGGVIVIADREGALATRSFGVADVARDVPVDLSHRFQIGSISKVFASLVINQLVDEAALDLEAPIGQLLDWLADSAAGAVTVRQLLNHSGGLVAGADALTGDLAQAWLLRDLAMAPVGQQFHYSNVGYILLGLAATAVTGSDYPTLVRDRLLVPMGMRESAAAILVADRAGYATGYEPAQDDRPWAPGDAVVPAPWVEVLAAEGNIASTGNDISRLIRLLLGSGELDGRRVVSAAAIDRMSQLVGPGGEPILDPPGVPPVESSRYGLGVNVERIRGHECLSHGGGMVGYSTFVLADRTAGFGIAVLTNASGDCPTSQLVARVGHALLAADVDAELPLPVAVADVALGRFALRGRANDDQVLDVTPAGDPAAAAIHVGGVAGRLFPNHRGRLVTDHPLLRTFHLDVVTIGGTRCWTHGPDVYYPVGTAVPEPEPGPPTSGSTAPETIVGHYRSYTPWYPNFRIIHRLGRLLLAAPGGVEAPDVEVELVELSAGVFRVGAEPWMPERLVVGPTVAGRAISLDRDGCGYARMATP
jgi:CubicO group peptidase (beta-lactamase class C family)